MDLALPYADGTLCMISRPLEAIGPDDSIRSTHPRTQRWTSRSEGATQFERRRLQMAIRQRRRLLKARAEFKRSLDRAISQTMQQELRLQIKLDTTYLARPGFIAMFDFLGQRWVLAHQRSLRGEQWYFRAAGDQRLVCCAPQSLEVQLCHALSHYCLHYHQSA